MYKNTFKYLMFGSYLMVEWCRAAQFKENATSWEVDEVIRRVTVIR